MPVGPSCLAAIAIVAATTMLAGCYTTRVVSPDVLRAAGAELERPRILRGDEVARLEPETMVRAQLASGGRTDWFRASGLRLSEDGVLISRGLPARAVDRIWVSNLDQGRLEALKSLTPSGAELVRTTGSVEEYELRTTVTERPLSWATRFVAGSLSADGPSGAWRMHSSDEVDAVGGTLPVIATDGDLQIAGANPAATFARGLRWTEISALELRSLDPFATALGTVLFPVGLLMVLATPDNAAAVPRDDRAPYTPIPWTAHVNEGQPLFTDQARRRANIQAIGGLDAAASFWGDLATGVRVGARFRHIYEYSFLFRRLSIADAGPDGARVDRFGPGFGFGLHIDSDDDPFFSMYFGGEITIAGKQMVTGGLHWGPRFALGKYLSLMIAPLDIMEVNVERPGASSFKAFRILSGLSLVGAY